MQHAAFEPIFFHKLILFFFTFASIFVCYFMVACAIQVFSSATYTFCRFQVFHRFYLVCVFVHFLFSSKIFRREFINKQIKAQTHIKRRHENCCWSACHVSDDILAAFNTITLEQCRQLNNGCYFFFFLLNVKRKNLFLCVPFMLAYVAYDMIDFLWIVASLCCCSCLSW